MPVTKTKPFTIGARKAATKEVRIPFEGSEIVLEYFPSVWTLRVAMELEGLDDIARVKYNIALLSRAIAKWNLAESEDGPMLPIAEDTFIDMDSEMLSAITTGITEDRNPKLPTSAPSLAS